jgi:hypothetical protein
MYPDALYRLEHLDILRLLVWGAASVLAGTAVLVTLVVGRARSALLSGFGALTVAWGVTELGVAAWRWRVLAPRDLSGAVALDRLVWFITGIDLGIIAVGATLAVAGWRLGRRLEPTGAGMATVVQGAALFALHTRLLVALLSLG